MNIGKKKIHFANPNFSMPGFPTRIVPDLPANSRFEVASWPTILAIMYLMVNYGFYFDKTFLPTRTSYLLVKTYSLKRLLSTVVKHYCV